MISVLNLQWWKKMIFSCSMSCSRSLAITLTEAEKMKAFYHMAEFLVYKEVEEIHYNASKLTFEVSLFHVGWGNNIMGTIDKGIITLEDREGKTTLTYRFFLLRNLIAITVAAILTGLMYGQVWRGILVFIALSSLSWLFTLIRHSSLLDEYEQCIREAVELSAPLPAP